MIDNVFKIVQGFLRIKGEGSKVLDLSNDAYANEALPVKRTWGSNNNNYKEDVVIKNGGTGTHSVTVAADSWLTQLNVSSSGEFIKYLVAVGGVNRFVIFTGLSEFSKTITLASPIKVLNAQSVVITKTNLSNKDVSVYSTITLESING